MITNEFLAYLAIIIGLASFVPYFLSIYKEETKPHPFSWFLWGTLTAIACYDQIANGGGSGAWITAFMAVLCYAIVVIAVLKRETEITPSDWVALILALLSLAALATIPLWYGTSSQLIAVILIAITDMLGFYPTFRKSWNNPFEEASLTYGLNGLGLMVYLFAVENFTVTSALYPAIFMIINWSLVLMLMLRKEKLSYGSY